MKITSSTSKVKFRAWHKEKKFMYQNAFDHPDYILEDLLLSPDEFEVLQYTGLKDKNGVEIYEGDVMGDIWGNAYIQWCPKCCSFELISNSFGCLSCSRDVFWDEIVRGTNIEVIGNIYSNPELLEDK